MDKYQRRVILGEVLATIRADRGLHQADVAAALGKPQSYVSKYESARRRLDIQDLEAIAAALGTTLDGVLEKYRSAQRW